MHHPRSELRPSLGKAFFTKYSVAPKGVSFFDPFRNHPNVTAYWDDYLNAAGRQGDDLTKTIARLRQDGFTVTLADDAAFLGGKSLTYGPNTKVWEMYEEVLHSEVAQGLGKDAISSLTKELRKTFGIRRIRSAQPARAAEEIFVKEKLLQRPDLDSATRTVLNAQIVQLRLLGVSGGY